jgi:hypothetical protein
MKAWHIPLIVFGSVFIYSILKRLFIRGEIEKAFIIYDKNQLFLYQFIDYYAWEWARSGSYETHRYKLRKINLTNLNSEYEKKIAFSSARLMHGGANVIGINNKYFYVNIDGRLYIVDVTTGKRIAKKKTILKKNPKIKDFDINDIIYSKTLETILIYDKRGNSHYLDTDTLILKRLNREIEENEEVKSFFNINDLPLVELKSFTYDHKESGLYYFPDDIEVQYISKPGTAQSYIYIDKNKKEKKVHHTELKECFLHPTVLSEDNKEFPYVKGKEPILIVIHAKEFKPKAGELMLSAVIGDSEVLWTKKLSELFINASFGNDNKLCYLEHKNNLILFLSSGNNIYKMSLCTINKEDGKIIHKPIQYINRGIKF